MKVPSGSWSPVVRPAPCSTHIDAVQLAGRGEILFPAPHQAVEKRLLHRSVRFGHRQQARHRFPGTRFVHRGHEARQFAEHARRHGAGFDDQLRTADQGAGSKIGFAGDRREAIALDGEAENGDTRSMGGHSAIPISSAIRGVAFNPLPVITSTVVCSGVIVPVSSNFANAAAAWALVGST